ncbi:MAG: ATP-dependent sacrificial sulfur transferase LarE [Deltaproteobacteria bacterium]|nr:ATP-dependent sacrificial sulfur transferase LarE [Deltaproteobacteria bacterium]
MDRNTVSPREAIKGLKTYLSSLGDVAVAFSGGVDSSVLLAVAVQALADSKNKLTALTAISQAYPGSDLRSAEQVVETLSVPWEKLKTDVLSIPGVSANREDRCYHCKKHVFSKLIVFAQKHGLGTVVDATNFSDLSEYRPGRKALEELGVKSPFLELGIDKATIRILARDLSLKTADRPSTACLLTRLPYGTRPTNGLLARLDKAEDFLRSIGFGVVRVRHHGDIARLELGEQELPLAIEMHDNISETLLGMGWKFVTLDLAGYEPGRFDKIGDNNKNGERQRQEEK